MQDLIVPQRVAQRLVEIADAPIFPLVDGQERDRVVAAGGSLGVSFSIRKYSGSLDGGDRGSYARPPRIGSDCIGCSFVVRLSVELDENRHALIVGVLAYADRGASRSREGTSFATTLQMSRMTGCVMCTRTPMLIMNVETNCRMVEASLQLGNAEINSG